MDHSVVVTPKILVLLSEVRILVIQQNSKTMKKATGYKEMLRDRCPRVVNYALKWQKAKERWIDHAYVNFVKIFCDKKERYNTTRIILGIKKYYRNFDFDKSIDWDNLTPEETAYWHRISSWVRWFMEKYAYIENAYKISHNAGKDEFDIKVEIINNYFSGLMPKEDASQEEKLAKYQYIDDLVDFLIKCFNGKVK